MLYQNQNDETLVMLTLAGEQQAYEVLVVRYEKKVISAALSVTKNQFMAEDAAQDAFVTAWMKLNTLSDPPKFAAWVCRIAKNCALNMVSRFRSFLPIDTVDNLNINEEQNADPSEVYSEKEETEELHKSISMLPEKVKQVIHMHYFDGLSIVEIAERMSVSVGTVKWQLHDGRKRIRKELCAMSEKWNDTLLMRVMKKVEELKNWKLKNDKSGFEIIYKDVLKEVEELNDSEGKYHALADVLVCGWWWLTGEKSDEMFERIKQAAIAGKNDEVMKFILGREDSKVYGKARIDFMRNKQIPKLEEAGFVGALAYEWFWLAVKYFEEKQANEGYEALKKVQSILQPSDTYYAYALAVESTESKRFGDHYKDKSPNNYRLLSSADEIRIIDGEARLYEEDWYLEGDLYSVNTDTERIFKRASLCDSSFTVKGLALGETHIGSDGTTLTFVSDSESVTVPAGRFDCCELWVAKHKNETVKAYYKDGVGIVKLERKHDGIPEVRELKSYNIVGGKGLLPLTKGNVWEYASEHREDIVRHASKITVIYADEKKAILSQNAEVERLKYDENSWLDMVLQIRNEYWQEVNGENRVCDVSYPMQRALALAKTPVEKAHAKVACSVAQRIMDTNPKFNKDYKATGHWNFFNRRTANKIEGIISLKDYSQRFNFELKNTGIMGDAYYPVLFNDIYGILQDAANCIWSDEWRVGATPAVEYMWSTNKPIKTQITCEEGGSITTKAGKFENCLKITLDISGMKDGWSYRGGKKVYYFADGIGIVRVESDYSDGIKTAVYELTAYSGKGEGYMPVEGGLFRRYDAIGLTDGFVGSVEYEYAEGEDGQVIIFADREGIRKVMAPVTQYGAIQGEVEEEHLWEVGKHEESRLCHAMNNVNILLHFLGRDSRYWKAPKNAVAWNKQRMNIVKALSDDGEVPSAWYGFYALTAFRTACALFGAKQKEEGYEYLEKAYKCAQKCIGQREGDLLDIGDPFVYGGIKAVKGKEYVVLPDGTKKAISYEWLFDSDIGDMYYGLTAPHGWEWFNSVRNEDRYKEYTERIRALMLKTK